MKIKYVHSMEPDREKIFDTEETLKGSIGLLHALGTEISQKDWDQAELQRLANDLKTGCILSYEIINS